MFQSIASQFQQLPRSWGWSGHQGWDHSRGCHSLAHCSALHMVSISTIGMENALKHVNVTCNFSKVKSENAFLISKVNHDLILTYLISQIVILELLFQLKTIIPSIHVSKLFIYDTAAHKLWEFSWDSSQKTLENISLIVFFNG